MVEKIDYTPKTAEEYIKFDKAMRHSLEPNEIKPIVRKMMMLKIKQYLGYIALGG